MRRMFERCLTAVSGGLSNSSVGGSHRTALDARRVRVVVGVNGSAIVGLDHLAVRGKQLVTYVEIESSFLATEKSGSLLATTGVLGSRAAGGYGSLLTTAGVNWNNCEVAVRDDNLLVTAGLLSSRAAGGHGSSADYRWG